ncbi:MAG: hypothetical protein K0U98_21410 [Deltaproteobacteria bacterium]|nr:hypothetical protein [Deltaproteobacteria bacterium]
MELLSESHQVANQVSHLLEGPTRAVDSYQSALKTLDAFVVRHQSELGEDSIIASFFGEFIVRLKAATKSPETVTQEASALLLEFCAAMGSGVDSMEAVLTSSRSGEPLATPPERLNPSDEPDPRLGKIPVAVLVIEDDATFASKLATSIARYFQSDEHFQVQVILHVPMRGESGQISETQGAFRARLRRRLETLTKGQESGLVYLQAAIVDFSLTAMSPGPTPTSSLTGLDLAHTLHKRMPNLHISFLSGENLLQLVDRTGTHFGPAYWKHDSSSILELHKAIRRDLYEKLEAPYWEALRSFTERPLSTFHAMPLARARSLQNGSVLNDFREFFGQNYFDAETSATVEPLDSLLHPVGPIRRAEKKAASVFGAEKSFFVTNGTSTANKIVLQALLGRGDAVLLDRNCHVSHHYGVGLLGARPYYLEPYQLQQYGISGAIPLDNIEAALSAHLERFVGGLEANPLPRLLMLTNRTFDGVLTKPALIICKVRSFLERNGYAERLKDIVFFFDEAWFAYGRFHPFYVEFSALTVAKNLRRSDSYYAENLRVYVTQSTHKTLSAFRQGSMIHCSDPLFNRTGVEQKFNLSFRTHTTTSPHSGIIASLDVSSRQVSLEGTARVNRALYWAQCFRDDAASRPEEAALWKRDFLVLDEEDMIPDVHRRGLDPRAWDFRLDPTCITIHFSAGWSGSELKRRLLVEQDVQVNKHSENTILMMVTLGSNYSDIVAMKLALMRTSETLRARTGEGGGDWQEQATGYPLPRFSGFWKGEVEGKHPGLSHDIAFFVDNLAGWKTAWIDLRDGGGRISASYVSPYPPGYPVLVPGQEVDQSTVDYLLSLHSKEIHGLKGQEDRRFLEVFEVR